jgi:hypothetical protein
MTQDRAVANRAGSFEKSNHVLAAIISRGVIDNDNRKFWKVLPNE